MALQKKNQSVIVDLADKHNVALTRFKGKSYFHIRHNTKGKCVSLNMADMQTLVDNFPMMKKKLKKLKLQDDDDDDEDEYDEQRSSKKKKKNKKQKRHDDSDDDDDDDDEDRSRKRSAVTDSD
jgi:hypothetical protein